MRIETFKQRLEAKIERVPFSGCWLWLGWVDYQGYGRSGHVFAHRRVYSLYRGVIPRGLCVCHHCDVPSCVNPGHMFLGTRSDNMQDSLKKGRHGWRKR
jgi:hypothetical protein